VNNNIPEQPELIPGIHWPEVFETSKNIADIYEVDIRTIQLWDQKGYIKRDGRGVYHFISVIRGIYNFQLALINKKKGTEGQELDDLELREQRAKTEKSEIELAKLRGELVLASEVKTEMFNLARRTRDAIENIPSRIAAILAAESNEHKVKELLSTELKQALEGLSK